MMKYKNDFLAELTQLENYTRTCFVVLLRVPNGQGQTINGFIDRFMSDLTGGELNLTTLPDKFKNAFGDNQVLLDACFYYLLPQCREATTPQETDLYGLAKDWVHDNLVRCSVCGEWFLPDDDWTTNEPCPICGEYDND